MSSSRFAVIGLGQFGSSIARQLSSRGAEVLAIDNSEDHIEAVAGEVAYGVTMDATDMKALRSQNIQDMDAVIVAIGDSAASTLTDHVPEDVASPHVLAQGRLGEARERGRR